MVAMEVWWVMRRLFADGGNMVMLEGAKQGVSVEKGRQESLWWRQ